MIYLDTSYIAKSYLRERGTEAVLALIGGKTGLSCCHHGRLEFFAAVHRHVGEGRLRPEDAERTFKRLAADETSGLWNWIPVTTGLVAAASERVRLLPADVSLRAADALHLTCASANGFECLYSHDRRMLDAAQSFGLVGLDIIA